MAKPTYNHKRNPIKCISFELRGPAHVKLASPTNYQNQGKNETIYNHNRHPIECFPLPLKPLTSVTGISLQAFPVYAKMAKPTCNHKMNPIKCIPFKLKPLTTVTGLPLNAFPYH